ncbi:MAG: hypothetical protein IBJ18_08490 [Phycisphaerales bacterium]|nr:hypothetical protein [Phycisphaerales bacterium]
MRIGAFSDMGTNADWLWNQCDGEFGRDSTGVRFEHQARDAERVFCFNLPFFPKGQGKLPRWKRLLLKARGSAAYRQHKADLAFEMLGTQRAKTSMLLYEPPPIAGNFYQAAAKYCSTIWSPDERAPGHVTPVVLPAFWMLMEDVRSLRAQQPRESAVALAGVISGKTALAGHGQRLEFLKLLRKAGVELELFGMGLPSEVGGRGGIGSKGQILRAAKCTLAIENFDQGEMYVTEKLWDPLLSWSVPLYFGPRAAEKLVPAESFIRIPSLDAAGVEVVRRAVSDPDVRTKRLEAISEARRRCLEELRLPVWLSSRLG